MQLMYHKTPTLTSTIHSSTFQQLTILHTTKLRKHHKSSIFSPLALKTPLLQPQQQKRQICITNPSNNTTTITKTQYGSVQLGFIEGNLNPDLTLSLDNKEFISNNNTTLDVLRLIDGLELVISPDIYASLIDECTQKRDFVQASYLFCHMKRNSRMVNYLNLPSGLFLFNRILLMFVSCGSFHVACQVFDEMRHRNFLSLAIVLGGFIDNHLYDEALRLFVKMHKYFIYQEGDLGLEVVLVCFLKACEHLKMVNLGKMVHGWLIKMGYGRCLVVDTALIKFYGKSSCLFEANNVFYDNIKKVNHKDTLLWTGAIVNNSREQCFHEVIKIFKDMFGAKVRMNEYTFSCVLKACGRVGDGGSFGKQVHANAMKLGFDTQGFVLCGLINLYGKYGFLEEAKRVFDMIDQSKRNCACWNAMVCGYMNNGLYFEALKMLYQMKGAGFEPQKSMVDEVRLGCGSLKL